MIQRRAILLGAAAAALARPARQAQNDKPLKIGVLNDMSGVFADYQGPGSLLAAQMAVEDSHGARAGSRAVEIVFADHQNKPDIGHGDRPPLARPGRRAGGDGRAKLRHRAGGGEVRDASATGSFIGVGAGSAELTGPRLFAQHRAVGLRHVGDQPRAGPARSPRVAARPGSRLRRGLCTFGARTGHQHHGGGDRRPAAR